MKRFEIFEFTISSTFSSLIETIAELEKRGLIDNEKKIEIIKSIQRAKK